MKLTDEQIIAALLACPTNAEAAEELSITESYLYKRMRADGFREKYQRAVKHMFKACLEMAQRALTESLNTMIEIMQDKGNSAQTRLNAAVAVRDSATKLQAAAGVEKENNLSFDWEFV